MRKLKLIEQISLDGVIQVAGGPGEDGGFPYGDWTAPYRSPAGFAAMLAAHGERFDLLLGRKTYDLWSGYWPKAPKNPMADRLNAATKYVVTHRPKSLEWGPFEGVGSDVINGVRAIKAKDGPNLILSGGSTLTSSLLEHGLADEVLLIVYPVLLGKGNVSLPKARRHAHWRLRALRLSRRGSSSVPTGWMARFDASGRKCVRRKQKPVGGNVDWLLSLWCGSRNSVHPLWQCEARRRILPKRSDRCLPAKFKKTEIEALDRISVLE